MKTTQRAFALFSMFLMLGIFTACNTEVAKTEEPKSEAPTASETPEPTAEKPAVLNCNLATKEELMAIPHITETIAQGILDSRPLIGMAYLDPYLKDAGLSDAQRKEVYVKMFLPIDLNTADRETIMMVPGMGEKMAHEFEEYRPYKKIEQFRREIGKYVDEAEVARFEKYVFVPVELNTATEAEIMQIPGMGKKMLHEFLEYRPYKSMEQFNREIGKYVDDGELARLRSYVYIGG